FLPGPRGLVATNLQPLRWPPKDPADILDYQFDIAPALAGNDGDSIQTIDVLISPANQGDLSLASSAADGTRAVLWLQGGVAGKTYNVTVMIGTETGRVISRSISLPVIAMAVQTASNLPLTTENGSVLVDSDGNALILGDGSY
ncbi:MAG: hypothetical protein RQ966_09375, partial [Acetobacteraceae bacterium]|nr:hypothetical protein [Acetobacteraceae bacterium]